LKEINLLFSILHLEESERRAFKEGGREGGRRKAIKVLTFFEKIATYCQSILYSLPRPVCNLQDKALTT
jgi:hypothetical protein